MEEHERDLTASIFQSSAGVSPAHTWPTSGAVSQKTFTVDSDLDPWRADQSMPSHAALVSSKPPSLPDYSSDATSPARSMQQQNSTTRQASGDMNVDPDFPAERQALPSAGRKGSDEGLKDIQWYLDLDRIKVMVAPERSGSLFDKHVNYEVQSGRHGVKVRRRYSDFVWLQDVLMQRFPFRLIPQLPPKKFGGGDNAFLEQRRKGLKRFINVIGNHPVLRNADIVVVFLTLPEEMATYRKTNNIHLDEEFLSKTISPELMASIPSALDSILDNFRMNLAVTVTQQQERVTLMERQAQRFIGQCFDTMKYGKLMESATCEHVRDCPRGQCIACKQQDEAFLVLQQQFSGIAQVHEQQARNAFDGIVESLKRQLDLYTAFADLFARRDKLILSELSAVHKRIITNENRLAAIRTKVPGTTDKETERIEASISADQKFVELHAKRNEFMRVCMWDEVQWVHRNKAFGSVMYGQYVHSCIEQTEKLLEQWKRMAAYTAEMPTVFS